MADGKNKKFRNDPKGFLRKYQLTMPAGSGSVTLGGRQIRFTVPVLSGVFDIDLLPVPKRNEVWITTWNRPGPPNRNPGKWFPGAAPVYANFLKVIQEQEPTINLNNAAKYFLTDELTGCLVAAYGANNSSLTLEHMNRTVDLDELTDRATDLRAQYPPPNVCKILAREPQDPGDRVAGVHYYTGPTWIIGHYHNGWRFYYRSFGQPVQELT